MTRHIKQSVATPRRAVTTTYLPPHLDEVCTILARGVIRLRAVPAADTAFQGPPVSGESCLPNIAGSSGHANRTNRRDP